MCNVHFILTLTPPWLQVKVTKYFNFVNLDAWWVAVCVRFSSETTQPISPMVIPIYRVNNVDLQHIHHFDFHPSMTAGQGHKILQFCEFRLLPWHECWYMSGPYKVAGDWLDLVSLLVNFCVNLDKWLSDMTFYGPDEWFWAMFEPNPTSPNCTFGQLFISIWANNDLIWLPGG